ncbi:hypothetical protein PV341_15600 [Streptomyces sp. PA03-1a]|nr:hypothetical protein [Streptomyces sp. PA03-1a]
MAHRVDHRQVQVVPLEALVEGVAADLVRGLQHGAGGHLGRAEGPRRQEGPHQLRGGAHRAAADEPQHVVARPRTGDDRQARHVGERAAAGEQFGVDPVGGDLHDADPLHAVHEGEPHRDPVVPLAQAQ